MKRKVWDLTVLDNPNRAIGGENDQFYTTDTEAFLVFNLSDENFNPTEAMLTLVNTADRSVVSEEVAVTDGTIKWEMREEIIEHAGNWQAQLVYKQMKASVEEKYNSQIVTFNVLGHLLDTREAGIVAIENWNSFVKDAEDLFADWVDLEDLRQANEEQRIINEEARQENYSELVDTGIMQENINQKLAEAEQEYAPRLTELERFNINDAQYKIKFEVVNNQPRLIYGRAD